MCVCSYMCIHIPHLYSSVDGCLGSFRALAIIVLSYYSASVNTGKHISFQVSVFVSFKYIP